MAERVDWITERAQFDELADEWDRLADVERTPFLRHAWFRAWLDSFGPTTVRTCILRRSGTLEAALPLRSTRWGAATIANVHTPLIRPLGLHTDAIMALYAQAAQEFKELAITPLPREFLRRVDAVAIAAELGRWTAIEQRNASPIVETDGDFGAWRRDSKRRWGAPLERFRRKAERERSGQLSLVFTPQDLDAELGECLEVEASGWKGKNQTAVLSRPETAAFYRAVSAAFHERGELRLSTYRLDGRLAACDLCLLAQGRLYLLKTGYDEVFRKLAPGLVLQLSVIERCFETDIEAFELLGGEAEWKRKFSTSERDHVALRTFARRPVSAFRYAYYTGLRPLLKRGYQGLRRE